MLMSPSKSCALDEGSRSKWRGHSSKIVRRKMSRAREEKLTSKNPTVPMPLAVADSDGAILWALDIFLLPYASDFDKKKTRMPCANFRLEAPSLESVPMPCAIKMGFDYGFRRA